MKLKELIKDIEVLSTNAAPDTEISGISYDSRLTRPGDLFVAIKGFETDGHRYIPKAMERRARPQCCARISRRTERLMCRQPTAASDLQWRAESSSVTPRRK